MPDYGVDTPAWEPLPWSRAAERLDGNRNFWAVTASAAARPRAMPVWGVWHDGEHRFAFSCSPRARKARNLAENPSAVITTDDTVECLSVDGRALPVDDERRREQWIARYLAKYRPLGPELSADFLRQTSCSSSRASSTCRIRGGAGSPRSSGSSAPTSKGSVKRSTPDRAFAIFEREAEFATRATRWTFGP